MKSILIIGMGNFGKYLAEKLQELKNNIMIIDKNEKVIENLSVRFENAQIGDCNNPDVIKALGVQDFDACIVALDEDFQASLEITLNLKEAGAKYVISKASRDIQAKFLLRNGADEVIYPEKDMAERLAYKITGNTMYYFSLNDEYSVFEIATPKDWEGETIMSLNIRKKYGLNVLAIKNNEEILPSPTAEYCFKENDHIVVLGKREDMIKVTSKKIK